MAFLLGGWFRTDDDDINKLPVDLQDIYVCPWKVGYSSLVQPTLCPNPSRFFIRALSSYYNGDSL